MSDATRETRNMKQSTESLSAEHVRRRQYRRILPVGALRPGYLRLIIPHLFERSISKRASFFHHTPHHRPTPRA